ncbi:hypothetical protein GGR56DRAFT_673336 [Xylariaceae sp. FL0804]|nr:hypothetical protein GGR56DRAFT_673336 [Xylariaceae sp. FL0804]
MYRAPTGRTRSGPGGFVAVPQLDATEDDAEVRDPEQEPPRRTAQDRFRDRVQHVLRQSTSPQDSAHSSLQSSPALSDTTLVENEYFLQFDRQFYDQQFDEVDIGDYVENHGYYAPEVVSFASIKSLELGQGLEVRIKETPCDYTPGGLYCDGPPAEDLSYKGSDGLSEKLPATGFAPDYDYKPLSLRWRFLLSLCAALAALLALAVLALQVLPDASLANSVAPSSLNTTEIRVRSVLLSSSGVVDDEDALPLRARENGTDSGSTGPEAGTTGVAITISDFGDIYIQFRNLDSDFSAVHLDLRSVYLNPRRDYYDSGDVRYDFCGGGYNGNQPRH